MKSLTSKESSVSPSGTLAYFMSKKYSPRSCRYLQKWQKQPRITMATMGNLPFRQDYSFKKCT